MESNTTMSAIASAKILAARTYTRYAPWSRGKIKALHLLNRAAGRESRVLTRTRFGDRMELYIPDYVSSTIYASGHWEPVITQYVRSRLSPGDVFVDCGANIGYYSLIASRLVGAEGRVIAIEASPKIHARLINNIRLNGCKNVTPIHSAAASAKGELSIYLAHESNLGHSTVIPELANKEGMSYEAKVPADTLMNLVGVDYLRRARFIKIDVEGAELSVLTPVFGSLREFSPNTEWLIELAPSFGAHGQGAINRIFEEFTRAGYGLYKIPNTYQPEFWFAPPKKTHLTRLAEPPTELCDVVISRKDLDGSVVLIT